VFESKFVRVCGRGWGAQGQDGLCPVEDKIALSGAGNKSRSRNKKSGHENDDDDDDTNNNNKERPK